MPWLQGAALPQLTVVACRPVCAPIPWQLDERDASGSFVLEHGAVPNLDDPPGVVDANDLILFMASDLGQRAADHALPLGCVSATEVEATDPRTGSRGWAYLLRFPYAAPQSSTSYVHYDAAADRLDGASVALAFARGTPRVLAHRSGEDEVNLLDRMKIRASASFLWGLVTLRRTEDDVLTLPVAWHAGPIRIIRRQSVWIRLGWRWRTPIFAVDTFFNRDFAEMPVTLHLNFSPRLLFGKVAIRVSLDFRDLRGWQVETADGGRVAVDGTMSADKSAFARQEGRWFALHGPDLTLAQTLTLSPSLSGVRPRLYYRESLAADDPPESVRGALPEIGYTLTAWDQVSSGDHWFAANAYALPREQDVGEFMDLLHAPLRVAVRPLILNATGSDDRGQ